MTSKIKAFTLIELLVVIAIIAILAALVMPAFRSAQESGRTQACAGNLRQIGAAMFMFAQDNAGNFPESGSVISWGSTDPKTQKGPWTQQLAPYLSGSTSDPMTTKGGSVFTCPSSSLQVAADKYYSYFNGAHAAMAANGGFSSVNQRLIKMPAEHILSGDVSDWPSTGQTDADKDDYTQCPIDTQATFQNGTINILFADGHVSGLQWNKSPTSPNVAGYFDTFRMATHYQGVSTSGTTYSYLNP